MRNKIIFIASGPITFASARIRAFWLEPYLKESVIIEPDDNDDLRIPLGARAYVWSKRLNHDAMRAQREDGSLVFWDCCDPFWWFEDHTETISLIDAAVFSTLALKQDFEREFPSVKTYLIPDRIEKAHYTKLRAHTEQQSLRLIWFGLWFNRFSIYGALSALERLRKRYALDLSLTIFDDRPDKPLEYDTHIPINYQQWKLEHEAETLAAHDLAILPPYPEPWGLLKSNNKTLSAWAAGLPVSKAFQFERLHALCTRAELRESEKVHNLKTLSEYFLIEKSAKEWEVIIDAHS